MKADCELWSICGLNLIPVPDEFVNVCLNAGQLWTEEVQQVSRTCIHSPQCLSRPVEERTPLLGKRRELSHASAMTSCFGKTHYYCPPEGAWLCIISLDSLSHLLITQKAVQAGCQCNDSVRYASRSELFCVSPSGRDRTEDSTEWVRPAGWDHQALIGGHQQHSCMLPYTRIYLSVCMCPDAHVLSCSIRLIICVVWTTSWMLKLLIMHSVTSTWLICRNSWEGWAYIYYIYIGYLYS